MSGICGILQHDRQPCDRLLLQKMTDFLGDRGPDGQGIWCGDRVGLGHTLLIAADESIGEKQPLTLDRQIYLTADVRLDDRLSLIDRLRGQNCSVNLQDPDALLMLHAYLIWGENCLQYFLGDFAFAIWDDREKKLFCARDPLGIKPFFYADLDAVFIFSNTLNCLHLHPQVTKTLNEEAIADFLLFDFNQNPKTTTFKEIQRLPGGHCLTVRGDRVSLRRYWSLPVPDPLRFRQSEDYIEGFQYYLDLAVGDRLRREKVGIFLSGGLDSTSIAATALDVAQKYHFSLDLQGFTVVYRDRIPDGEEQYAQMAANALKMPLHCFRADDYKLFQGWNFPHLQTPEPILNPFPLQDCEQYQQIARHSAIGLYGEGADEAFRPSKVMDLWGKMSLFHLVSDLFSCIMQHRLSPAWGTGILARFRPLSSATDSGYPGWLNPDFERRLNLRDRWQEIMTPSPSPHPLRSHAYRDLLQPMWMLNFETSDPGFTGIPLEVRLPFLDLRLLNYLLALPPLPWFINKELERATLRWRRGKCDRHSLPVAIEQRPKTPLGGQPFYTFLQEGYNPWAELVQFEEIRAYIAVEMLLEQTREGIPDPLTAWRNLRPLCLGRWLIKN